MRLQTHRVAKHADPCAAGFGATATALSVEAGAYLAGMFGLPSTR
jgi:hypothetical protein